MNQSVEKNSNDLNVVQIVAEQIRVTELSYRMANDEALSEEIQSFFEGLTYHKSDDFVSAHKHLTSTIGIFTLPILLNNYAFISDRIYDVWGRKNKLSDEINSILKNWRHPLFKILHQMSNLALLELFIELVDRISNDSIGWESRPERSKRILLDELNGISELLFQVDSEQSLHELLLRWKLFSEKQYNKALKVTQRLKVLETRQSWEEYCELYAKKYLNTLFSDQLVTSALQKFILDFWVQVLAQGINKQLQPQIDEDVQTLTAKVKAVFCVKGKAALKWVDNLLEDMQSECAKQKVIVDEQVWEDIQSDLVNILQGNSLEELQFIGFDSPKGWIKQKELVLNKKIIEGAWFHFIKDSVESREQVLAIFPETQEVLFCNYLGIKTKRYTYTELNLAMTSQALKPLEVDSTFLEVVHKTNTGLLKVALTQKKSRAIAAEKAKREAERLLEEKLNAEKMAKIKAKEVAEQAKQRLQDNLAKQLLEQEQEALVQINNCKLGAWVAIKSHEESSDSKVQRFKLVVKFAATSKYIFVDKLGVKKVEYTESALVEGILSGDIEILSDGIEFEESLKRVVSRLRTSD